MKPVLVGAWACLLALGASYAAASYVIGGPDQAKTPGDNLIIGVQYKKVPGVNVPIIADGAVKGYVVANVVFTGDAQTLRSLPVPVDIFVRDELFRHLYNDSQLNFDKLSKYDVNGMISDVKKNVNLRLGSEVVREILLENINFIDRATITTAVEPADRNKFVPGKKGG